MARLTLSIFVGLRCLDDLRGQPLKRSVGFPAMNKKLLEELEPAMLSSDLLGDS